MAQEEGARVGVAVAWFFFKVLLFCVFGRRKGGKESKAMRSTGKKEREREREREKREESNNKTEAGKNVQKG